MQSGRVPDAAVCPDRTIWPRISRISPPQATAERRHADCFRRTRSLAGFGFERGPKGNLMTTRHWLRVLVKASSLLVLVAAGCSDAASDSSSSDFHAFKP